MGDLLMSMAMLVSDLGLDFDQIAEDSIKKLKKKLS